LNRQPGAVAQNTILNIQSCSAGFAVAAYDPAFGVLDGGGEKTLWRSAKGLLARHPRKPSGAGMNVPDPLAANMNVPNSSALTVAARGKCEIQRTGSSQS
jgi:hypothetical protein